VSFLLSRGASALVQDLSGGSVLHHAVEKGHLCVLQVLQEHGLETTQAVEIADNAGRTPLFEAVENNAGTDIIRMLVRKRGENGLGAKVNVLNYRGQTPLYSAVREGNMQVVRILVEEAGALVDLNAGELVKPGDHEE